METSVRIARIEGFFVLVRGKRGRGRGRDGMAWHGWYGMDGMAWMEW